MHNIVLYINSTCAAALTTTILETRLTGSMGSLPVSTACFIAIISSTRAIKLDSQRMYRSSKNERYLPLCCFWYRDYRQFYEQYYKHFTCMTFVKDWNFCQANMELASFNCRTFSGVEMNISRKSWFGRYITCKLMCTYLVKIGPQLIWQWLW